MKSYRNHKGRKELKKEYGKTINVLNFVIFSNPSDHSKKWFFKKH